MRTVIYSCDICNTHVKLIDLYHLKSEYGDGRGCVDPRIYGIDIEICADCQRELKQYISDMKKSHATQ